MFLKINDLYNVLYDKTILQIEIYGPKIIGALIILLVGLLIGRGIFIFLMYLFKKIKLNETIDKLKVDFDEETVGVKQNSNKSKNKFSEKIKIDNVVSKAVSYYVIIIFLRISISYIGISEIEQFLRDLTAYLPNLFVGILIGFFGIRFSNFIYDVVYHTLNITREKTSKIIASGARIIILFFTLMVFLDYTKVVSVFIINTILIGFISMLSLGAGLAFGLGGKDIAKEILESFRK